MLLKRSAYSMMDWIIVFSVVLAVAVMFRTSIKRIINKKAVQTTDFMLWQRWGGDVPRDDGDLFGTDLNVQAKTGTTQEQRQTVLERHDRSIAYGSTQNRATRSVSVGVAKEQEEALAADSLNRLNIDVDATGDLE